MSIKENVKRLLDELPAGVTLVAAAKTRTPGQVLQAVDAGITIIGENYVQEALAAFAVVGSRASWHMIGHLQRNKVKQAVEIFDAIETVDSLRLASEIDKRCARIGRTMPVLIEINSGRESQKAGVLPEDAEDLLRGLASFKRVKVEGLMTMGPQSGDPEDARPYFEETKRLFDEMKGLQLTNIEMRHLSMGMSNSYRVAIEEGADMIRVGTGIFGLRQ